MTDAPHTLPSPGLEPLRRDDALEPCPFCAKPVYVKRGRINPYGCCVTENCFGRRMPVVSLDIPADVEAWNTRAPLPGAVAQGVGHCGALIAVAKMAKCAAEMELGFATAPDFSPREMLDAANVALASAAASSWQPDITAGMKAAMEIVGNMRQSESGLFDAMHSGQRGEDRSNALYDAYCAIRRALLVPSTEEK